jgi:hypothetical protein
MDRLPKLLEEISSFPKEILTHGEVSDIVEQYYYHKEENVYYNIMSNVRSINYGTYEYKKEDVINTITKGTEDHYQEIECRNALLRQFKLGIDQFFFERNNALNTYIKRTVDDGFDYSREIIIDEIEDYFVGKVNRIIEKEGN